MTVVDYRLRPVPSFTGVRFHVTPLAVAKERNFPASRHRSRRIHKKLVQRHGGEFREVPACYVVQGVMWIHPTLHLKLLAETKAKMERAMDDEFMNALFGRGYGGRS